MIELKPLTFGIMRCYGFDKMRFQNIMDCDQALQERDYCKTYIGTYYNEMDAKVKFVFEHRDGRLIIESE